MACMARCKNEVTSLARLWLAVPLQPVRTFGKNCADWENMLIFGEQSTGDEVAV